VSSLKDNSIVQLIALSPEVKWNIRPMTKDEKNNTKYNDPNIPEMEYALEIPGHRIWATQKEILEFIGWYPFREQAKPKPNFYSSDKSTKIVLKDRIKKDMKEDGGE